MRDASPDEQRASGLVVEQVAVVKLTTMGAPWNPRKISDHDMAALRASLRTWGAVEPVVVNKRSGRIVGGPDRKGVACA